MRFLQPAENRHRITVTLTTLFALGSWALLLADLTRYWHEIPHRAHYGAIMFCVLYPFPWLTLVLRDRSKLQMAIITYLALFAAMKFIFP
jgi:hypothetical protein